MDRALRSIVRAIELKYVIQVALSNSSNRVDAMYLTYDDFVKLIEELRKRGFEFLGIVENGDEDSYPCKTAILRKDNKYIRITWKNRGFIESIWIEINTYRPPP